MIFFFLPFAVSVLFQNFSKAPLYYFLPKHTQKFPKSGKNGFENPSVNFAGLSRLAHAKSR